MKKEKKPFSELYSPEMKLRISEAHSMIMEQAGDLNLSSVIPNWKNMKLGDLVKSIEYVSFKKIPQEINIKEESSYFSYYASPRWRNSKFGIMTIDELGEYAASSPQNRKEVRDFVEKEYAWLIKNITEFEKSVMRKSVERSIKKGKDPFDSYYDVGKMNKSGIIALLGFITLMIQLSIYLMF